MADHSTYASWLDEPRQIGGQRASTM